MGPGCSKGETKRVDRFERENTHNSVAKSTFCETNPIILIFWYNFGEKVLFFGYILQLNVNPKPQTVNRNICVRNYHKTHICGPYCFIPFSGIDHQQMYGQW